MVFLAVVIVADQYPAARTWFGRLAAEDAHRDLRLRHRAMARPEIRPLSSLDRLYADAFRRRTHYVTQSAPCFAGGSSDPCSFMYPTSSAPSLTARSAAARASSSQRS